MSPIGTMADYVLAVDLGDAAGPMQYMALRQLMYGFGFTLRGPETLTPAQFSITSTFSLGGLKRMVEDLIKAELQANVFVDAYEIKQFNTTRPPDCRRFH
jgi:hypothetical protein